METPVLLVRFKPESSEFWKNGVLQVTLVIERELQKTVAAVNV